MSKLSGIVVLFFLIIPSAKAGPIDLWAILTSIHPASAKPTPKIKELITKPIELTGFAILDENKDEDLSDFLFSSVQVGCIHNPLPPPNRLIHVKMENGKISPTLLDRRISIHGKIAISTRSDSSYEMIADSVKN